MAFRNLATGRLADGLGAGTVVAQPGLVFTALTILTLCAPPLREGYARRLASNAVPAVPAPHARLPPTDHERAHAARMLQTLKKYASIAFGQRCDAAGVHPSMGSVGDAYDNALCESFFATVLLTLDEPALPPGYAGVLALAHLVEGVAEMAQDVKLVEQDAATSRSREDRACANRLADCRAHWRPLTFRTGADD